jgi:mxaA protein
MNRNTMNNIILKIAFSLMLLMSQLSANALETDLLPDIKDGIVSITITEPDHDVGYTVGDILTRDITIQVKKPYVLIKESLPIVGYERRYKGQLIGIDLSALTHSEKDEGKTVTHHISLSYQVFTNNVVAKPAALPAEFLRILDSSSKKQEVYRYRIPSWNFAISPISVFGQVKVEDDMSGYRGPILLDASPYQLRLKAAVIVLALSLLGLLYILGKHTWLPRMGGPFAKAYKTIRKAQNNETGIQQAVEALHSALNKSAGYSLFSNNLEPFLHQKSSFKHIHSELNQFFELSRHVFFEPHSPQKITDNPLKWLAVFCKQCRDCERGLTPDSAATQAKAG